MRQHGLLPGSDFRRKKGKNKDLQSSRPVFKIVVRSAGASSQIAVKRWTRSVAGFSIATSACRISLSFTGYFAPLTET